MSEFQGKRILIIHNGGEAQAQRFRNVCEQLGLKLDRIFDKPNEKAFGKIAGRLHLGFYEKVLNSYYKKNINSLENNYDYILVIRGEYTPIETLQYLREKNPYAKMILYMWDSIRNNHGIEKKWPFFDKVHTFDRKDYLKHKEEIGFIPLFYCEEYVQKLKDISSKAKYDIAFIGTAHGDRVKIVKAIEKECEKCGLKMYKFLYCPHILVFFYNKVFNPDYKYVKKKELTFRAMSQMDMYKIYAQSKCVLDAEIKTQTGLTMRTMDILGLKKKLITTNQDIVNYDFYNKNNISILDRTNINLDYSFINKPYESLPDNIYNKYSMKSWLVQLLSGV